MVKLWSNFGQKMGYLTIKFEKIEKNFFILFIRMKLMRTVSGSSHGPKKLGPNYSYGPFRPKIWSNMGQKKVNFNPKFEKSFFFVFSEFNSRRRFQGALIDPSSSEKTQVMDSLLK